MIIINPFTNEFLQYFDNFCIPENFSLDINYNKTTINRKGVIYLEKGYKKQLYPDLKIITTPMILNRIDRAEIISNLKPLHGEFVIYNSGYVNYEFVDSIHNINVCTLKNNISFNKDELMVERFTMEKYIKNFVNV